MDHFDVVVIGGGPAGENIAGRCGDCGLRIAVVEAWPFFLPVPRTAPTYSPDYR